MNSTTGNNFAFYIDNEEGSSIPSIITCLWNSGYGQVLPIIVSVFAFDPGQCCSYPLPDGRVAPTLLEWYPFGANYNGGANGKGYKGDGFGDDPGGAEEQCYYQASGNTTGCGSGNDLPSWVSIEEWGYITQGVFHWPNDDPPNGGQATGEHNNATNMVGGEYGVTASGYVGALVAQCNDSVC